MNEEKKPKFIVVTESPVGDRPPVERRYRADFWDVDGDLTIRETDENSNAIAVYARGAWLSAREDGAEVPFYGPGRKLAIALEALREIAAMGDDEVITAPGRAEAYLADIQDVDQ